MKVVSTYGICGKNCVNELVFIDIDRWFQGDYEEKAYQKKCARGDQ